MTEQAKNFIIETQRYMDGLEAMYRIISIEGKKHEDLPRSYRDFIYGILTFRDYGAAAYVSEDNTLIILENHIKYEIKKGDEYEMTDFDRVQKVLLKAAENLEYHIDAEKRLSVTWNGKVVFHY